MSVKPYMVGITGGSASGKTLFLNSLTNAFTSKDLCLVSQDNYYLERHLQPKDPNGIFNFDTPASIDHEAFAADLATLMRGETVERQEYTFNNPLVKPKTIVLKPAPVIVVEGIFVFYYPQVASQLDLKVFLDAKEIIKLKRRIKRDRDERGYDLDDVLYRYEHHVAPTYDRYIRPFKDDADLIIPNNDHFDNATEIIIHYLKTKIAK